MDRLLAFKTYLEIRRQNRTDKVLSVLNLFVSYQLLFRLLEAFGELLLFKKLILTTFGSVSFLSGGAELYH